MSNASRMHVQINIILNKFKHFFFSFTFIFIIKKNRALPGSNASKYKKSSGSM